MSCCFSWARYYQWCCPVSVLHIVAILCYVYHQIVELLELVPLDSSRGKNSISPTQSKEKVICRSRPYGRYKGAGRNILALTLPFQFVVQPATSFTSNCGILAYLLPLLHTAPYVHIGGQQPLVWNNPCC